METAPCIFCDCRNFTERLIYENDLFYVIATLGQITDGGYLLLVPKAHISCIAALPEKDVRAEMARMMFFCISASHDRRDRGQHPPVTLFEHGIVGQTIPHAHLHIVPAALDLTAEIRKDFPASETADIRSFEMLSARYAEKPGPYLLWTAPDGELMTCWNPPAPAQYLRIKAAHALGRPERANWRTMDQSLDAELWRETVSSLRSLFVKTLD